MLYWMSKQLIGKVTKVSDSGLSLVNGKRAGVAPATLTVEIVVTVLPAPNAPAGELSCGDMLAIINPEQSAKVDSLIQCPNARLE